MNAIQQIEMQMELLENIRGENHANGQHHKRAVTKNR